MSSFRQKALTNLKPGASFTVSRTFSQNDVALFSDISRDYNPVHYSTDFAKAKNLDGPICHGLLVGSLLTEIGGQLGWLASEMRFSFLKPVYLNDTIRCTMTIDAIDEKGRASAEAVFSNQHDRVVLRARLHGILPGPAERGIMEKLPTPEDLPTAKPAGSSSRRKRSDG